ncbi:hypothetical protein PtrSN002B_002574 [Pyrenophora tritici-repentis]|nr:hypothetical protein PtrSN001A_003100 [Pyrenophora tritici-repentis]KAI1555986.1 hypothetical protein PtrSN002B_002574 [Pyrenophora tritici-repentis]KAI1575185.1 hypothetical protein PtrEW4_002822 [Pyrenophora tritici-repentis]PZC97367.1 hypothetical protein A1F95_04790 [Pyrenophora tritici-repentis]PZD30469.1 hypothetical protein A1F96_04338 [Pyrenophora tritici-repentis]
MFDDHRPAPTWKLLPDFHSEAKPSILTSDPDSPATWYRIRARNHPPDLVMQNGLCTGYAYDQHIMHVIHEKIINKMSSGDRFLALTWNYDQNGNLKETPHVTRQELSAHAQLVVDRYARQPRVQTDFPNFTASIPNTSKTRDQYTQTLPTHVRQEDTQTNTNFTAATKTANIQVDTKKPPNPPNTDSHKRKSNLQKAMQQEKTKNKKLEALLLEAEEKNKKLEASMREEQEKSKAMGYSSEMEIQG